MMGIDDGDSAFPATEANYHNENMRSPGMSMRDYFAARAMNALVCGAMSDGSAWDPDVAERVASASFCIADAMLAARNA